MRQVEGFERDVRSSALWGKGSNGGSRSSALWGKKGGRSAVASFALVIAFMVPVAAASADDGGSSGSGSGSSERLYAVVPAALVAQAQANPDRLFRVIVQGVRGESSDAVAGAVESENGRLKKKFLSINGVSATLAGKEILRLGRHQKVRAITPDVVGATQSYENNEVWRRSTKINLLWSGFPTNTLGPAPQAPAIAIVDSGIDASKAADFGSRVVAAVSVIDAGPEDGYGHGTMVAGLAAGASTTYKGVATNAPIVSIRAADAQGRLYTSDVIEAADWILQNKERYNIRVANFSLRTAAKTTFRLDPMNKAVQRLWFSGVVVVAAAGNQGTSGSEPMSYAPGNDPFVITVGALDTHGTVSPTDDTRPSWSAFGRTGDGFSKPDVAAPGRYLISPVPTGSALAVQGAGRVVAPGYMWMSGTSLSAPIVSGLAAQLLARYPSWSPDLVKGAITATATKVASEGAGSGQINASAAALATAPPNPNSALNTFVSGGEFNDTLWAQAAASGSFQTDWLETDWLATDWLATDWLETDWLETDWLETDWLETDWLETDWLE